MCEQADQSGHVGPDETLSFVISSFPLRFPRLLTIQGSVMLASRHANTCRRRNAMPRISFTGLSDHLGRRADVEETLLGAFPTRYGVTLPPLAWRLTAIPN